MSQILWEHSSITRWRSCNPDAPGEAQLHGDSNNTPAKAQGKWKDQSQLQDEHGGIAKVQILQTKIDRSPYGHLGSNVRNHLYGVDENLDSITLAGFGSLLTKILFSYRSTEVSGTLIVMKVPTERSRSWGRRAGKTATLWKCLKPTASDSLLGSCTRKYSPYGKIKYDTCFEMIDVVPFEMIYDKFRAVVVWPTTTEEKRNDSFRNDRWLSHWYDIWPSFRYQMTVTSKWFMTILSIGQQFL